jgi:hypothetical protein
VVPPEDSVRSNCCIDSDMDPKLLKLLKLDSPPPDLVAEIDRAVSESDRSDEFEDDKEPDRGEDDR